MEETVFVFRVLLQAQTSIRENVYHLNVYSCAYVFGTKLNSSFFSFSHISIHRWNLVWRVLYMRTQEILKS